MSNIARDFLYVLVAYVVALAIGVLAGGYAAAQGQSALVVAAIADTAATVVVFAASMMFRNSSFYDAYWSVAPPILFAFWIWVGSGLDIRMVLAMLVVMLWAVRLTLNWAKGWHGLTHEDWRYIDLKAQSGRAYWLVNFFGIHFFPTALVFAGCLPLWIAANSYEPLGWLDGVALVVGVGAVYLEWSADEALHAFRARRKDTSEVLQQGLWARCRHPNYLGEILFWASLALFGIAAGGGLWAVLGVVLMIGLFVGISIPMIDKRMLANKPAYAAYREATPSLIPSLTAKI